MSLPSPSPPTTRHCLLSYPSPHILLVLINRPDKLNSLTVEASNELDTVFRWFDDDASLRVAIISGVGKAFCVGADLKEWMTDQKRGVFMKLPENGFAGLSFRHGKKPIIAAVNGPALGGGCEIVVNCDLVIAGTSATFGLPEVKRGVTPFAGALPRLMMTMGKQRASELALTGRAVTAAEFKELGICNHVVADGHSVVDKAVEYARLIAENSPDAVIVTREGLKLGWEALGAGDASRIFFDGWGKRIREGLNMQEGLDAFTEKRPPRWHDSKL